VIRSANLRVHPSGARRVQLTELDANPSADAESSTAELEAAYARLRAAQQREPFPTLAARRDALAALGGAIRAHAAELIAAANADFGGRSPVTTKVGDISTMLRELDYQRARLSRWLAPEPRRLAWHFRPARGAVEPYPLGVVGVIAPWNYPFRLALGPTAAALAAGNRVLLKPSELTPRCASLIGELIERAELEDRVAVVLGDEAVAAGLCALPLDHLFFTGSTQVGRLVLRAASEHLTPVTLELGGKCPVVVHPRASLAWVARRVIAGKLFNAGQTCMAPDHLWVHKGQLERACQLLEAEIRAQYPTLAHNPDYTAIINSAHLRRLERLLADASDRGGRVRLVNPADERFEPGSTKLLPALVSEVSPDMALAREEIFGPVLPIRSYDDLEQVVAELSTSPSPLAAYYFDDDRERCRDFQRRIRAGGVCINDVMLHSIQDDLPFGGVGASGMGRYHGKEGFDTFSHQRAVFYQARRSWSELLIPPYSWLSRRVIDWLAR
jgi:coniferyl-aldehyde dehydrogenase